MSSRINIESIYKKYGNKNVLVDFKLKVEPSQFVAILGPSGCGKSTLLRIISGLEKPDSGKLFLNNVDITNLDPKDRDIAMVFQNYALYPHKTVYQNLVLGLELKKVEPSIIKKRLKDVASKLNINSLLNRKPGLLSGGEMQRVAVARALMKDPLLFLFDEPLSNLDANLRDRLREEIKRLHQELGITMIYVTHDQTEAMSLGDVLVIINDGLIQQVGTPEDIYLQPVNTFVAEFIGNIKMNILEAITEKGVIKFGSISLDKKKNIIPNYGKCLFGIRSSDILVNQDSEWLAQIISVDYFGNFWLLRCKLGNQIFNVNSEKYFAVGDSVHLSFNWDRVHYFDCKTKLRMK